MEYQPVRVLADLEALQDVVVSGSLIITTDTAFSASAIATGAVGEYSVDEAFHTLDQSVYQTNANIANAIAGVVTAYNNNRYIFSGSLDSSGSAVLNLTTSIISGSENFSSTELAKVTVNLLIDTNGDGRYRNDLTSYEIYTSGSELLVSIDAPASPNNNYRLIVSNEKPLNPISGSNGILIIAGPQGVAGPSGSTGAEGRSHINVASLLSTTNSIETVASNFSLSPAKAPNGFYIDVTGFTQDSSFPLVVKLYNLTTDSLLDSDLINTLSPQTVRLNGAIPSVSNTQFELRYYSSGSSSNYVYLQTAIVEITN